MEYNLPYFGNINLINLEEDYRMEAGYADNKIRLDLNFENKTISREKADLIKDFLQNINKQDQQNKIFIEKDFKDKGEASGYIDFYLEEFDENELSGIIGKQEDKIPVADQLLNKLRLIRVGIYPDGKYGTTCLGIFDYTIDIEGGPCDQLLVIKTNEQGEIADICWES